MNAKSLFTVAAFVASAAGAVHAEGYDIGQQVQAFESTRTRAEVQAEAVQVPKTRSTEPAGTRIVAVQSTANRQAVVQEAIASVATNQYIDGEVSRY
jgi:hypothetical protein